MKLRLPPLLNACKLGIPWKSCIQDPMDKDNIDELARSVGPQFSELVSSVMVGNILHFIEICKLHNIEETKLSSALSQYITEAKINGIKVSKPKGIKTKAPRVIVGDPMRYLVNRMDNNTKDDRQVPRYREIEIVKELSYNHNGITCHPTTEVLGDIMLLTDDEDAIVAGYDNNSDDLIDLSPEDKSYLVGQGYKVSSYA